MIIGNFCFLLDQIVMEIIQVNFVFGNDVMDQLLDSIFVEF